MYKNCFQTFTKPSHVEEFFLNDKVCKEYLRWLLWTNGVICPYCRTSKSIGRLDVDKYRCYNCKRLEFIITTRTVFHSSTAGVLPKWFKMIGLFVRNNINSYTFSDILDIEQKTAYLWQRKLRRALINISQDYKLSGIVEIDETFIGGDPKNNLRLQKAINEDKKEQKAYLDSIGLKYKNGKGRSRIKAYGHRTAVLGLHEREGRSVYIVLGDDKNAVRKEDIIPHLKKYIEKDAIVMTDEAPHYLKLKEHFPNHEIIRHKRSTKSKNKTYGKKTPLFARKKKIGDTELIITTNHIENDWRHIKREWDGIHVGYTKEHMQGYLAEAAWRDKKGYKKELFHQRFDELLRIACQYSFPNNEKRYFKWDYIEDPNDPNNFLLVEILEEFVIFILLTLLVIIVIVEQIFNFINLFFCYRR